MVLGQGLEDADGTRHAMTGLLGHATSFAQRKLQLGYREARLLTDSPIGSAGSVVRGHEFHYSDLAEAPPADTAAYTLAERDGAPEGYARGNVLASYVHLHFGARPDLATRFVERCRAAALL